MFTKRTSNVIGATGLFASILAVVVPALLKLVNALQTAETVTGVMSIVESDLVRVSWTGIWVVIGGLSFFSLVATNFQLVRDWWVLRQKDRRRVWNFPVREAIFHIAHVSVFGFGKTDRERFESAVRAFQEMAEAGEIEVRGRLPKSTRVVEVPRCAWEVGVLAPDTVSSRGHGTGGKIVSRDNADKVLYEGLLTDKRSVEKLWERSPLSRHGMGA